MATAAPEKKVMGYLPNDTPPFGQMVLLGLQHVLTMFPATVLCAILMKFPVSTVLTVTGFGTIVALVGSKLAIGKYIPLYYGSSFSYIAAVSAIMAAKGVDAAVAPPRLSRLRPPVSSPQVLSISWLVLSFVHRVVRKLLTKYCRPLSLVQWPLPLVSVLVPLPCKWHLVSLAPLSMSTL